MEKVITAWRIRIIQRNVPDGSASIPLLLEKISRDIGQETPCRTGTGWQRRILPQR
jgi:hypothetical protein